MCLIMEEFSHRTVWKNDSMFIHKIWSQWMNSQTSNRLIIAELRRPEGPSSWAPHSYRKEKETHELIFSWFSWIPISLVGACAWRRRRRRSRATWRPYSKEIWSLDLPYTSSLRTIEKCRKHSPAHRVFYTTFPSCSQMTVVVYHSVIYGLGFFIC